jgi:hypothetical protein
MKILSTDAKNVNIKLTIFIPLVSNIEKESVKKHKTSLSPHKRLMTKNLESLSSPLS